MVRQMKLFFLALFTTLAYGQIISVPAVPPSAGSPGSGTVTAGLLVLTMQGDAPVAANVTFTLSINGGAAKPVTYPVSAFTNAQTFSQVWVGDSFTVIVTASGGKVGWQATAQSGSQKWTGSGSF